MSFAVVASAWAIAALLCTLATLAIQRGYFILNQCLGCSKIGHGISECEEYECALCRGKYHLEKYCWEMDPAKEAWVRRIDEMEKELQSIREMWRDKVDEEKERRIELDRKLVEARSDFVQYRMKMTNAEWRFIDDLRRDGVRTEWMVLSRTATDGYWLIRMGPPEATWEQQPEDEADIDT